jgi:sodium transport system permease protein
MALKNIGTVYRKELTEALRDRRTLISTIIVPLLLFPVLGAGFAAVAVMMVGKAKHETPKVMLLGGADSPEIVSVLHKLRNIRIVNAGPDWKAQILNKGVRAAVEIAPHFEANLAAGNPSRVTIYEYEGDLKSSFAAGKIADSLKTYRDSVIKERLASRNLSESLLKPFEISDQNVAPPEKVGAAAFGGLIGYTVILLCMIGGMYPAIDLTAGEKERGTMETILSSPVSRTDLVLGKFLLVLTASLATAALAMLSMGGSFWFLQRFHAFDAATASGVDAIHMRLGVGPVLSVFLMAIPVAVLLSAVLLTIALFAKSNKEAQSYITPLMFLVIIPAVAAMLPGVELTPKFALVPILNVSLLSKDLVAGTYRWDYIALIFGSTCVYAAAAIVIAAKMFQRESVLFRS